MNNRHTDGNFNTHAINRKMALSLGVALLALASGSQALAVPGNPVWEGNVSDDWTDGDNWSGGVAPSLAGPVAVVAPAASDQAPVIDGVVGEANVLFLGSQDHANLTIQNGGQLNANNVTIGNSTNNGALPGIRDESGAINLIGPESGFSVDFLTVGYYGDGTLAIEGGAHTTIGTTTSVAALAGGSGTITLTGADSHLEGGDLQIGSGGNGTFTVSEGASAQTASAALGVNAGSSGTATLTGADTSWTTSGSLSIGGAGEGNLAISDGAVVSATGDISIGRQASGTGTLTVSGENSQLTTATNLFVGFSGTGDATVSDGAIMSADKIIVGFDTASSGTLVVDGANSVVKGTSYVMIGYTNDGEATISNGGTLKADGARGVTIAFQTGSNGTLNIGAAAGEAAAAAGHIDAVSGIKFGAGSGQLVLNHTDTDYVLAAPISGTGAVDILSGTTIFSGDSSLFSGSFTVDGGKAVMAGTAAAASTTINAGGVLQIGNGGASGSLNSDITNNGTLIFNRSDALLHDRAITGSGSLTVAGGTITLSGDSSGFAGDTTISGGTLLLTGSLGGNVLIEAGGTLQAGDTQQDGLLLADTVNNGTLIFSQAGDYDYTGALSGDGRLIKRGDGTLLLSGDYHYTGSTVVEGGIVRLTSQLDTASDLVVNNGTFDLGGRNQEVAGLNGTGGTLALGTGVLTVVQGQNSSFAGGITGTGGLIKAGTGTLNLTGTSNFSGQVDVNGGRLAVNGVLPGSVAVHNGGTLGGNGTVNTVIVNTGGTLAPGNSIGTLNVAGDILFKVGSVYEVEVDAAGNGDRTNVSGVATIQGGTVSVIAAAGAYRWTSDYVILTAAGGVNGTFADLDVNLPFLTPYLSYGARDVTLTLVRNDRSFESAGATVNQRAVARALDASAQNGALYRVIAGQIDDAGAVQAFDALSGELWATTGTFMVDRTRRLGELVVGRLEQTDTITHALAKTGSASSQTRDARTGIWGQATGSWNSAKSDGNAARATQSSFGFITGVDTLLGDWRIGLAFSHGEDKVQVGGRDSHATVTGSAIAAYVGGGWHNLRARAGGSYGWLDVKGARNVAFPGLSDKVSGRYDGKSASAFAELSYAATLGATLVEPFAGVNHVHLKTEGFAETGGTLSALNVSGHTRDVTYTTLGLRLGAVLPVTDQAAITPRLSAAWLHGFGDVAGDGRHELATGKAFSIEGMPATRNALRLEAGAQANIMPGGSLGLSYVGNIADRWSDHGLTLGFSYSF